MVAPSLKATGWHPPLRIHVPSHPDILLLGMTPGDALSKSHERSLEEETHHSGNCRAGNRGQLKCPHSREQSSSPAVGHTPGLTGS